MWPSKTGTKRGRVVGLLKKEEGDHKSRNAGSSGKAREQGDLLPESLHGGTQPGQHHDFSPVRSTSGFWPPEQSDNKFVLFDLLSLRYFVTVTVENEYRHFQEKSLLWAFISGRNAFSFKFFFKKWVQKYGFIVVNYKKSGVGSGGVIQFSLRTWRTLRFPLQRNLPTLLPIRLYYMFCWSKLGCTSYTYLQGKVWRLVSGKVDSPVVMYCLRLGTLLPWNNLARVQDGIGEVHSIWQRQDLASAWLYITNNSPGVGTFLSIHSKYPNEALTTRCIHLEAYNMQ